MFEVRASPDGAQGAFDPTEMHPTCPGGQEILSVIEPDAEPIPGSSL